MYTREFKLSIVAHYRDKTLYPVRYLQSQHKDHSVQFRALLPANYTTHLLSCTVLPTRALQFWRCGQFPSSLGIKRIFPWFENRRRHLLICVYGTSW